MNEVFFFVRTIMQFQVPQFIETEDKIVGPLTLWQSLYVGGAGIVIFFLYFLIGNIFMFLFISSILLGAALALSFIRISGRSLPAILHSAFTYYWNPQTYVWKPERPDFKKIDELKITADSQFLERVISGIVLKNAWRNLQAGTKESPKEKVRRYEIFRRAAGDRRIAQRIDFR